MLVKFQTRLSHHQKCKFTNKMTILAQFLTLYIQFLAWMERNICFKCFFVCNEIDLWSQLLLIFNKEMPHVSTPYICFSHDFVNSVLPLWENGDTYFSLDCVASSLWWHIAIFLSWIQLHIINPFGTETRIFQVNEVLDHCGTNCHDID